MTDVLYGWPSQAKFGRVVPKSKFYEHTHVTSTQRERFVTEIQRITWGYKLAENTINLAGDAVIPEIQVFQIECKGDDVSDAVLAVIDKAIPFPIIFEIVRESPDNRTVRTAAVPKQATAASPKISSYVSTEWQPTDAPRQPLPTAISLPGLYISLLAPMLPVMVRPGENVGQIAARLQAVQKLEKEIATLERKLRTEPQFNRKVELRRTLKTKQAELEEQR